MGEHGKAWKLAREKEEGSGEGERTRGARERRTKLRKDRKGSDSKE